MQTQQHPTHHDGYRPGLLMTAVISAVAGVFVFIAALTISAEPGSAARTVRTSLLVVSGLAVVVGCLTAFGLELVHFFARCPRCRWVIFRTRIDYQASYYPCWRCGIRWTCECHKD